MIVFEISSELELISILSGSRRLNLVLFLRLTRDIRVRLLEIPLELTHLLLCVSISAFQPGATALLDEKEIIAGLGWCYFFKLFQLT